MTLSFKLRELRWHGKLRRKRRPEVEVELRQNAKLGPVYMEVGDPR